MKYYPYGEEPVTTASGREKFGTYHRDQATNLDYADQRYYASGFGRFLTPDPYKASGGLGDPGSWNRYVYVMNDPINYRDRRGLEAEGDEDGDLDIGDGEGSGSGEYTTGEAGKGTTGGGGGDVFTKGGHGLDYLNLVGSSPKVDDVKNALSLLMENIDNDCAGWLGRRLDGYLNDEVAFLKVGVFDGVRDSTSGKWLGTSVAATANDAGYDFTVNAMGSFFGSTDVFGGLKVKFEILIHELAHVFNAPEFQNGDGDFDAAGKLTLQAQEKQKANSALLEKNCAKTIR
jgi:RHS repeat-associated protein